MFVTFRYNLKSARVRAAPATPSKMVTLRYGTGRHGGSPQNRPSLSYTTSRSSTPPPSASNGTRRSATPNIEESLDAMARYLETAEGAAADAEWLDDLKFVAQRLHFIKESYRLVLAMHRRRVAEKELKPTGDATFVEVQNGAAAASVAAPLSMLGVLGALGALGALAAPSAGASPQPLIHLSAAESDPDTGVETADADAYTPATPRAPPLRDDENLSSSSFVDSPVP